MLGSGPARKRKIRQDSSRDTSPVTIKEPINILSLRSVEETLNYTESPGTEVDEGVVTSCKRVRTSPLYQWQQREGSLGLDGHVILPPTTPSNEDSQRQSILLRPFRLANAWLQQNSYFTSFKSGRADSADPHDPDAVPIKRPGNDTMQQLGAFRPTNKLKQDKQATTPGRSSARKVFDLSEPSSESLLLNAHEEWSLPAKRQKTGPERYLRRNSSSVSPNLYDLEDEKRKSPVGSGAVKSVQSLGSRQTPSVIKGFGGVQEYRNVESLVGFSGGRKRSGKAEKFRSEILPPTRNGMTEKASIFSSGGGSSRHFAIRHTIDLDEVDEIEESTPPRPTRYKGTAHLAPARPKSQFAGFRQNGKLGPSQSKYFSGDEEDDSRDHLDEDYGVFASGEGEQPHRYDKNKGSIPRQISRSVSTKGDIPESSLSKAQPKSSRGKTVRQKPEDSYPVGYIQAGKFIWPPQLRKVEYEVDCEYRLDPLTRYFELFKDGVSMHDAYPTSTLKPFKISKIKWSEDSRCIQISRAAENGRDFSSKILIEIGRSTSKDFVRKMQSVAQSKGNRIELVTVPSEILDKIFVNEEKTWQNARDIELLEANQTRRQAQTQAKPRSRNPLSSEKSIQEIPKPDMERRRSSEAIGRPATPRQSISTNMRPKEPSNVHNLESASQDDDSMLDTSQIGTEIRRATRSSARNQTHELRQQPRMQSPDFVRWTEQNPGWENSWGSSLVYPADAKKKTTVDIADIPRLDEGQFLNDNLIQFYLRYLEDKLEKSQPEMAKRIYFQNTFFYEALTKGKPRNGNINYDAVKRWTAKVDLFQYDYIIVPVNESFHWYLAIIYNAPKFIHPDVQEIPDSQEVKDLEEGQTRRDEEELVNGMDRVVQKSKHRTSDSPDSMSKTVTRDVEIMTLEEKEWPEPDLVPESTRGNAGNGFTTLDHLEKVTEALANVTHEFQRSNEMMKGGKQKARKSLPRKPKFGVNEPKIITLDSLGVAHSATCVRLREYLVCEAKEKHGLDVEPPSRLGMTAEFIPQQANHCDCGIYVLAYIQKFLENPDEFIRLILQREPNDWSDLEAPSMRRSIRDLVFDLQTDQINRETFQRSAKKAAKIARTENRSGRLVMEELPITDHGSSAPASPSHSLGLAEPLRPEASKTRDRDIDNHSNNNYQQQNSRRSSTPPHNTNIDERSSARSDDDIMEMKSTPVKAKVSRRHARNAPENLLYENDLQQKMSSPPASSPIRHATTQSMSKKMDANGAEFNSAKQKGATLSAPFEIEGPYVGTQDKQSAERGTFDQGDFEDIMESTEKSHANVGRPSAKASPPAVFATRTSPRMKKKAIRF